MGAIFGLLGVEDKQLLKNLSKPLPQAKGNSFCVGDRFGVGVETNGANKAVIGENRLNLVAFQGRIKNRESIRRTDADKDLRKDPADLISFVYDRDGLKGLQKITGPWQALIVDKKADEAYLFRDRWGKSPVYYCQQGEALYFSSQLKSLLPFSKEKEVNRTALSEFLGLRYVLPPKTLVKNIYKLEAGSCLRYNFKKCKKSAKLYLKPNYKSQRDKSSLTDLLKNSVENSVSNAEDIGVFLSGGVDSSSLAVFAQEKSEKNIDTFTVGFKDSKSNDLSCARSVSEMIGSDHHEILLNKDIIKLLPDVIKAFDEPIADLGILPNYLLAQKAAKYTNIALSGEGADEIFGGYAYYKVAKLLSLAGRMPQSGRNYLFKILDRLPLSALDLVFRYSSKLGDKGKERIKSLQGGIDNVKIYLAIMQIFNQQERTEITGQSRSLRPKLAPFFEERDLLNAIFWLEIKRNLPENLLMKIDKSALATGLSTATPFIDGQILNHSRHISPLRRIGKLNSKPVLRRSLSKKLPRKIRRRKKQRLFIPFHRWLEDSDVLNFTLAMLNRGVRRGHFKQSYVNKIEKNLTSSPLYYGRQMWSLLVFETWYENFLVE